MLEKNVSLLKTKLQAELTPETTSLAPIGEFRSIQQTALNAVTLLDISTSAILVQPDFLSLEKVPQLPEHQKASKTSALAWKETVRPKLFAVNDTIINFNTEFNSLYSYLYQFAEDLSDPNKCADAQTNLIAGILELQKTLRLQQSKVIDANTHINNLLSTMLTCESNLGGDLTLITAQYTGDTGTLHDLTEAIESYEHAMSNDLTIIGLGAAAGVVGLLTIGVGAVLWVESLGGSTPVILLGLAITAGGAAAVGYGISDYNTFSNKKAAATRQLAVLDKEIAVANSLKTGVSSLVQQLDQSTKALDQLSVAWNQLDRDYSSLITALQSTHGNIEQTKPLSFIVKANLTTSKEHWNILQNDAKAIKDNILKTPSIDTSALDNSDGKTPVSPNVPRYVQSTRNMGSATQHPPTYNYHNFYPDKYPCCPCHKHRKNFLRSTPNRSTFYTSTPNASTSNANLKAAQPTSTGYTLWIDNIAKSLLSFEQSLNDLTLTTQVPTPVTNASEQLKAISTSSISAIHLFLASNETLSSNATLLKETADLDDASLLRCVPHVLATLTTQTNEAIASGKAASTQVAQLEGAIDAIDVALSDWLNDMKAEQAFDQAKLADVTRLRDQAQKEKDNLKKDYWFCFLGAIACAVVAIEVNIRINNAQAEINAYNKNIATLDTVLSELLLAINITTSLTGNAIILSNNIDGVLKALQYISTTLEGLNTNLDNLTPFILKSHLRALADQIDGIATVRLTYAARMLSNAIAKDEPADIISMLQQLTYSSIMVHSSASTCVHQPKLVYVENLLKQDQALLSGNALEWIISYSNNILSQLSGFKSVGMSIKNLGDEIIKYIKQDDLDAASAGIDAIISTFTLLQEKQFNDALRITLFAHDLENNKSRFTTVSDELATKLEGKQGELAALQQSQVAYEQVIKNTLANLVNESTRMVCEFLTWEAVLIFSIGLGQIPIATNLAPTFMYLIKKATKITLDTVSVSGAFVASQEISKIEAQQVDLDTYITGKEETLVKISALSADIAVLTLLLDDLETMSTYTTQILNLFNLLITAIHEQIQSFYLIKYTLIGSNPQDGLALLETTLENWEHITKAASLLESNFMCNR